ncbi:MAG: metalloregulator ArsR/SmtB family transcription factor, partial [Alphaproteobacteria bacterium]|nr:metalloregulator ArsR/SmtB family transcription factor [Alphaproteobacteria bacterium]
MLLNFFKALAHESRLRLIGFVAEREHSVQELATRMALKEPTVSHHLALLREVGLVSLRQDGTTH